MRLAHLVGSDGAVFAFEPTDYAFEKLLRHIQLNPNLKNGFMHFSKSLQVRLKKISRRLFVQVGPLILMRRFMRFIKDRPCL